MAGSDSPLSYKSSPDSDCFVFEKYVVKTDNLEEGGQHITIYDRGDSQEADRTCEITRKPILYVKDEDNNTFFGVTGPLLFVDSGTSLESRDIAIYDLRTGSAVARFEYTGDPKVSEGKFILFDAPSGKKGPISSCKDAAKWKRQGGGVGWVIARQFDLQTYRQTTLGTLKCIYMQ